MFISSRTSVSNWFTSELLVIVCNSAILQKEGVPLPSPSYSANILVDLLHFRVVHWDSESLRKYEVFSDSNSAL